MPTFGRDQAMSSYCYKKKSISVHAYYTTVHCSAVFRIRIRLYMDPQWSWILDPGLDTEAIKLTQMTFLHFLPKLFSNALYPTWFTRTTCYRPKVILFNCVKREGEM
jgi:hypothetical protein